jgi:tetratricopeptide (TPR) repeat protein
MRHIVASEAPEFEAPAKAEAAWAQLWRSRKFDEAAALAARAMALWPEAAVFREYRARGLLAAGALVEAEAAAREALLLQPDVEALWVILADSLLRRSRNQEALDALSEACAILPGSLALLGRLGKHAQRLREYQKAINAFSVAVELEPEKEFWLLQLLGALRAAKRTDQALKWIETGLTRFPQSATLHCQFSSYMARESRHAEAENAARRALEGDPRLTEAHDALFAAQMAQQRFGDAFRDLQTACETFPEDGSLWQLLGRSAMKRSLLDLAISAFERAANLPEASANAWTGLINALFARQRYADAAEQAGRALLVFSANHNLAVLLAEALLRSGDAVESVKTKMADKLGAGSNSTPVSHAIMDALIRIERPDEVLSLAASRDDQHSSSPETRLRFAKALLAMNAADQAEQELRAIVEEQPEWIPGLDALCDSLRLQKKIKEALALFRRIETLDPDQAVLRNLRYRMFGTSE